MNKEICFEFMGKQFWLTLAELRDFLEKITAEGNAINPAHSSKAQNLLRRLDQSVISPQNSPYFQFKIEADYYKMKELLFCYHIVEEMIDSGLWIELPMPQLSSEKIVSFEARAKRYSDYRYNVDNGWRGVLAQDLVTDYLSSLGIRLQRYEGTSQGIDEYDICVGTIRVDIKCATQANYIEMTPKVIVATSKVKDYYIATKFFENRNSIVIIGYFDHADLGCYPFKVLYGTPYWGVKLYNAKPLRNLIDLLRSESTGT